MWCVVSSMLSRQSSGAIDTYHCMPTVGDRLRRHWINMASEVDPISNQKWSTGRVCYHCDIILFTKHSYQQKAVLQWIIADLLLLATL